MTIIGGLGLFLEPAGRPRGRLKVSPSAAEETGETAFGTLGDIRATSVPDMFEFPLSCSCFLSISPNIRHFEENVQ